MAYSKEKMAEYQREWYQRRKETDPDWAKKRHARSAETRRDKKLKAVEFMGDKCHDCGTTFPSCVYEFHHLDSSKDNLTPSQVLHHSWDAIEAMLKECVMLCANCHRLRHAEDGYSAHEKRNYLKRKYG